jgi:hypothetical protein
VCKGVDEQPPRRPASEIGRRDQPGCKGTAAIEQVETMGFAKIDGELDCSDL